MITNGGYSSPSRRPINRRPVMMTNPMMYNPYRMRVNPNMMYPSQSRQPMYVQAGRPSYRPNNINNMNMMYNRRPLKNKPVRQSIVVPRTYTTKANRRMAMMQRQQANFYPMNGFSVRNNQF